MEKYWESRKRIIKDNGAIVLTASQPFTSMLVMSNLKMFKYEWVLKKSKSASFHNIKYQPLKRHENILIFGGFAITYSKLENYGIYNAQMRKAIESTLARAKYGYKDKEIKSTGINHIFSGKYIHNKNKDITKSYPISLIEIKSENNNIHPTQKPVALFEYLIKTYTNEGDLVFDGFAGSGTTGVAAIKTDRNFICIEKDLEIFQKAEKRIKREQSILKLNFAA